MDQTQHREHPLILSELGWSWAKLAGCTPDLAGRVYKIWRWAVATFAGGEWRSILDTERAERRDIPRVSSIYVLLHLSCGIIVGPATWESPDRVE